MDKKNIKSILIVCTGNSCRSVMAEGYLKRRFKDLGKQISVFSAGTSAYEGMAPSEEAVNIMKEMDIDISDHKAVKAVQKMVTEADMVLVMEPHHKRQLLHIATGQEDKIFYLRNFEREGEQDSIPDPIGKGKVFYRNVMGVIEKSLEGLIRWMEN